LIFALPLGLAIGVAVGALGGGGSVLAVPVLVYVLGQTVPEATTASLVIVAAGRSPGASAMHARGHCWRHAASFTAAAIPGIAIGTVANEALSATLLLAGSAIVTLISPQAIWRRASSATEEDARAPQLGAVCPPLRLPRDVVVGAAVGFVTGLFGVGGGFLIVPMLSVALAFTMRTAVGTSLAIITGTSVLALVAHLLAGRGVDVGVTVAMSAACVAGAAMGARAAGRLSQRTLGRGFAALVVVASGYLTVSVALLGGPPA
jgi:hypothetical protein